MKVYPATRYLTPLKEGGSLPAVLDSEGGGLFVVKFRGAGHGARALVAEIIVAGLAQAAGLPVPETALIELDDSFGRSERDPEIQDILAGSRGTNFGMRYLEGALNFDPASDTIDATLAARILWLDAFVSNVDRTPKNPNLMWWRDRVWLIDHGSSLFFHHNWATVDEERARGVTMDDTAHVLLSLAGDLTMADEHMRAALSRDVVGASIAAVPDDLLMDSPEGVEPPFGSADDNRDAYARYFEWRLGDTSVFLESMRRAQELVGQAGPRKSYRR